MTPDVVFISKPFCFLFCRPIWAFPQQRIGLQGVPPFFWARRPESDGSYRTIRPFTVWRQKPGRSICEFFMILVAALFWTWRPHQKVFVVFWRNYSVNKKLSKHQCCQNTVFCSPEISGSFFLLLYLFRSVWIFKAPHFTFYTPQKSFTTCLSME